MAAFSEDFPSGDDFVSVLAIFCFYDYSANTSEAVKKIATDGKDYHLARYSLLHSHNISLITVKKVAY